MRLVLVVSGGPVGTPPRTVVQTVPGTAMDEEYRALVAQADLGRFPEPTMRTGDHVRYTLLFEDGDTRHSILFDEERTPAQFRPLIEAILRDGKPGG